MLHLPPPVEDATALVLACVVVVILAVGIYLLMHGKP